MHVRLGGGCPCDTVRFEITEVFDAGYCHCNRYRKTTGAPVFAFVFVPRAAFSLLIGELVASWPRHDLRLLSGVRLLRYGRSRLAVHWHRPVG
jgi:hypothetical protein